MAERAQPVPRAGYAVGILRNAAGMHAYVYKSLKKADTYVYLAGRDAFTRLPEQIRERLGQLQFVLEVELTPERRLARANAVEVREHLATHGFHIQFPPELAADPMTDDWGTDA